MGLCLITRSGVFNPNLNLKIVCFLHTHVGINIFLSSSSLTLGGTVEISCTVTNVSADSIRLLRDNQMVAEISSNTQLNVTISVNDTLHVSQFSCEAQQTGSQTGTAYSNPVTVTVKGNGAVVR